MLRASSRHKAARVWRGGVKAVLPAAFSSSGLQSRYDANENGRGVEWRQATLAAIGLSALTYWMYTKRKALPIFFPAVKCTEKLSRRFNFLAETVERVLPSIVYIECDHVVPVLFGEAIAKSSGSGFIVEGGGYVLTNAHVVGRSKTVRVKLQDGRELEGVVTDIDEVTDLALVKLGLRKGETLPALDLGPSSEVRPGEWVVALGSPLSLSNTITSGIVSSVHRPSSDIGLQHHKPDMEYIQTDAVITVGNSGGPLVNLDGEVIGINTMTAFPGISFAIPSSFAKEFLKRAKREEIRKSETRPKKYGIGISMLTINQRVLPHIQSRTSFNVTNGVLLAEVWRGSPADRAGLKKGDIIVKMNSKEVRSTSEIFDMVQTGSGIEFEVIRGNEKKIIRVKPEVLR